MSIIVVCPGCRKSFKVNDKFAGKSGPCPNCKQTIKVPEKKEEVVVHAPEAFEGGGRTTSGKLVIKPIEFETTKLRPVPTVLIVAAVLTMVVLAWIGGRAELFRSVWVASVCLVVISPALTIAAYAILRDAELEPYTGRELYIRASLCTLAYAALWGIFTLLVARGFITGELWSWLYVAPPFVVVGGLFAMAAFDFDFGNGLFHYGFYLLAIIGLRWLAGMKWVWDISR
jgi:hypothetical protein